MTYLKTHTIAARTHGRYLVDVPAGTGPFPMIVGFHGYGENAEVHHRQLQRIPDVDRWLVVSVQALHPFYQAKSGNVVASWMTKQDRERAIQDNMDYVGKVISEVKTAYLVGNCLVYTGFSQGVAMAYRAAAYAAHPCAGCLALGGDVPPEICADPGITLPAVLVARGDRDTWYTQEKMDNDLRCLRAKKAKVRSLVFDGGHEWTEKFLEAAGSFLNAVLTEKEL